MAHLKTVFMPQTGKNPKKLLLTENMKNSERGVFL